ncbi:hypothetical protein PABG_00235 [Paracoccidioides brasiliensis Pb03]|uniref:Uncharacterized protein n=1 Tax=Paracoccidioides brasiliensis (strain Pb18) TaxID=502780 RepID=A0A0A0HVB7_PARBD|nr:uncharacterized protein PADG_11461 [Paracoccidioides brasiliensis Pb18]EEH17672.2 hypothetical protein PABG_00235 [Paracoccidioides brasiliensis Pb03]KGM92273.1 hypothetical protein PADG_11461 [Paracoccidioides brasiliensis Pb18]ODH52176.1 hypothetical protein GX48_01733 [Paracoccidioides brasiliensis]
MPLVQPQPDLALVGFGAAGLVYEVGDDVVFKTCQVEEVPSSDTSGDDRRWSVRDAPLGFLLIFVDRNGNLALPEIGTGHQGIDTIIRKACLGEVSSNSQMLTHPDSINTDMKHIAHDVTPPRRQWKS